jgi:hypothetical protein
MWEFGEEEATDQQKEEPKDGIFLIRPSASRPGFYALEISQNGSVVSQLGICFLLQLMLCYLLSILA